MKQVLVTGASGFIGGTICYELKRQGHNVLGLDLVKPKHLRPYMDIFFLQDFKNIPDLRSPAFQDCDVVIHCAGSSLVGPSIDNPSLYYYNNVAKTIKLLKWCVENNKHFMFSSSASVYKTKNKPIVEDDPKEPLSPYAKSKWMIEQVVEDFVRSHNLKATIFRYFNACGSVDEVHGQPPGAEHIFPRLFEQKTLFTLNGEDYNTPDGTCIRDYIHVQDIADAHLKAMEKDCYGVYNLGSGSGYSNRQIIDAVGVRTWMVGERRIGDSDCLVADNTLAKKILGWVPLNTLDDIVNDLRLWYNSKTFSGLKASSRSTNSAAYD